VNVGIVGCGYWGTNLARNFLRSDDFNLKMVADHDPVQLNRFQELYPDTDVSHSFQDLLLNTSIDAVAIATPAGTHFDLAKRALEANRHVLVEKPATTSSKEMHELIQLAKAKKKVLMVDHTYLYSKAVLEMKAIIDANELGAIQYIDSERVNLGKFQPDINVLWDLATHDISIVNFLLGDMPKSVQCQAIAHLPTGFENIAYTTLKYPNNVMVHIHSSWSSPLKRREMLIGGDKKMLRYNDLEPSNKLHIHDCGHDYSPNKEGSPEIVYRNGTVRSLPIPSKETLGDVVSAFAESIRTGIHPLGNINFGLEVIQILEAAQESIDNGGKTVML